MIEEPEVRVYVRHIRACGYCLIPGARDCARHHGLDWRDFIRNGIPVSTLKMINDVMCQNIVAKALQEHSQKPPQHKQPPQEQK